MLGRTDEQALRGERVLGPDRVVVERERVFGQLEELWPRALDPRIARNLKFGALGSQLYACSLNLSTGFARKPIVDKLGHRAADAPPEAVRNLATG